MKALLRAAHMRHARYYASVLRDAHELYLKGGSHVIEALTLADVNWQNIVSAYYWLSRLSGDLEAAQLCASFPCTGFHILNLRLTPPVYVSWLRNAQGAASVLGDAVLEMRLLGNIGIALKNSGDNLGALQASQEQLCIAERLNDLRTQCSALCNIGLAQKNLKEFKLSRACLERGLVLARQLEDTRVCGVLLGNLGIPYLRLGDVEKALTCFVEALAIARAVGDRRGEGADLCNMGLAYSESGAHDKAMECYSLQLSIARELGDEVLESNALMNMAESLESLGDRTAARDCARGAVDLRKKWDSPRLEGAEGFLLRLEGPVGVPATPG